MSALTGYATDTGNPETDALIYGVRWASGPGGVLSYSFAGLGSLWDASYGYGIGSEPGTGFAPLSDIGQQAVRNALLAWSSVADIQFQEVADDASGYGTVRIGYTTLGMDASQLGYTYAPADSANGGDVWLNAQLKDSLYASFAPGSLASYVLLHELGHALGLKHPHAESPLNNATLGSLEDSVFNSVMSYYAWPGVALTQTNIDRLPSTPMALDIDALQALYGANTTYRAGDDTYSYDGNGKYLETIFDAGGNDTIEVSGSRDAEIDLRPDEWSQLGLPVQINAGSIQSADTVRIYRDTQIENAIGGEGNDRLIGNDGANQLTGNGGNDTLEGGAGNDTLTGGTGADAYVLSANGEDTITDFSLAQGDKLDVGGVITSLIGYTAGQNPFASGFLTLSQSSAEALLSYDGDGAGNGYVDQPLARLLNTSAVSLDEYSFLQGYKPIIAPQYVAGVTLTGTDANDTLEGGVDDDTINGLAGDDTITDLGGDDLIDGGDGADKITGGPGNDRIQGGLGNDNINDNFGSNTIDGGDGDDSIYAMSAGNNSIQGGLGDDQLAGGDGDDTIDGGDGIDFIQGVGGNDILRGGAGDDRLNGGLGDDILDGGDGNDSLNTYEGAPGFSDTLLGGNGNDILESATIGTGVLDGGAGDDLFKISMYWGGSQTPTLTATGGAGIDTYELGPGTPVYSFTLTDFGVGLGGDRIDVKGLLDWSAYTGGYTGGNPFSVANGYLRLLQSGVDTLFQYDIDGAAGIAYSLETAIVLQNVTATSITADNFVGSIVPDGSTVPGLTLNGTAGNDALAGGYFDDTINGLAGDDTITDLGGDDLIDGGDGADKITGGPGNDRIQGGLGNDNINDNFGSNTIDGGDGDDSIYAMSAGNNSIQGGLGDDQLAGGDGDDTIDGGDGIDFIQGVGGNDILRGGAGDDRLNGGLGDDILDGGDGNDSLNTYEGAPGFSDTLLGGNGSDILESATIGTGVLDGGAGDDLFKISMYWGGSQTPTLTATGGAGIDTYELGPGTPVYSFTLTDFAAGLGGDRIDVKGLLDWSAYAGGYTGGNPFSAANGYMRLLQSGADTLLQYDIDGAAGTAYTLQTAIVLQNVSATSITGDNFVGKVITGTAADDNLVGEWTNDKLYGLAGNDTLDGGEGADRMEGGSGADTYMVADAGDDVYEADNTPSGSSGLKLGIDLGSAIDTVIASIDYRLTDYVERLTLAAGTSGLTGTGNTLDNLLTGNDGDNTLTGGAGNDTLDGGAGTDTATYTGNRTAYTITQIASGYTVADTYSADGDEGTDTLIGIERLVFAETSMNLGSNNAPTLANALADRTVVTDAAVSFTVPANSFADVDAGDSLSYTATLESGDALPHWLIFNANTRIFSSTPGVSDIGTINIRVTATDASNSSVADMFALTVADAASTPTLWGKTYFWNKVVAQGSNAAGHVLMDGVTVSANDAGSAWDGTTAAGGNFSVAGVTATTVAVTASQTVSTADKAGVTLGDALEVLKLYLGKLSSPSPYKYLASDFNADSKVTLTDALAILKSVLNKTGALAPAWVFVDEEANVSALTKDSAARPAIDAHPVGTDPSLNLVALLRGDANGSWKPAATASYEVLPDAYFTDASTGLVGLHPDYMSTGQFGL